MYLVIPVHSKQIVSIFAHLYVWGQDKKDTMVKFSAWRGKSNHLQIFCMKFVISVGDNIFLLN